MGIFFLTYNLIYIIKSKYGNKNILKSNFVLFEPLCVQKKKKKKRNDKIKRKKIKRKYIIFFVLYVLYFFFLFF